jgi:hypothetical protein
VRLERSVSNGTSTGQVIVQVYAIQLGLIHKLTHQRADYFRVSPHLGPKKHLGVEETWYGRNSVCEEDIEDEDAPVMEA